VISLRYHIVSLVAVFLALALGIVVGSTVLREGTVSVLRATSERVRQDNESYRTENLGLKQEQARWQDFAATVLPDLVRGRLKDRHVVLLDTDKVDRGVRDQVTRELVRRVAERLGAPNPLPNRDPDRKNDLLTSLNDGGFLADLKLAAPVADGRGVFPSPGTSFVVLGPTDGVALPPEAFLIPLANELAVQVAGPVTGVEALAAGATPGTTSWITKLRQDRLVTRQVSGVDDVDTAYGQLALVGALERGLQNLPPGQYGAKQGNSGLLPDKVPAS
jgi:hypothetical protein